MPEIGTSGSMSGDGKRGVGHRPQATAPILDSTEETLVKALGMLGSEHTGERDNAAVTLAIFSSFSLKRISLSSASRSRAACLNFAN